MNPNAYVPRSDTIFQGMAVDTSESKQSIAGQDQDAGETLTGARDMNMQEQNQQQANQIEVTDVLRSKVENYNIDMAMDDLKKAIDTCANMMIELKQIKFEYLMQVCELYARIDLPSVMMDTCRKKIMQTIPSAKEIDKL